MVTQLWRPQLSWMTDDFLSPLSPHELTSRLIGRLPKLGMTPISVATGLGLTGSVVDNVVFLRVGWTRPAGLFDLCPVFTGTISVHPGGSQITGVVSVSSRAQRLVSMWMTTVMSALVAAVIWCGASAALGRSSGVAFVGVLCGLALAFVSHAAVNSATDGTRQMWEVARPRVQQVVDNR